MAGTDEQPKFLYVFAGPNGSGKSTLTEQIKRDRLIPFPADDHYINPDVIAKSLPPGDPVEVARLASEEAERRRKLFLSRGESFAFETVLPHPSKIGPMIEGKERGFAVALFFVATESPELNALRIANRVAQGGHDVPRDRVPDRYARAMRLLPRATEIADVSRIFDNSTRALPLRPAIQIVDGQLQLLGPVPAWMEQAVAVPHAERRVARDALTQAAASQGVALSPADELRGQYSGRIDVVSHHYIVQRVSKDRAVLHDRAVLEIGTRTGFKRGQMVALGYRDGASQAQTITPAIAKQRGMDLPPPNPRRGPER